ncbi:hypothetical protein IMCC21906_01105 [Spongiibacter sp. IMCC21906]|jgi:hypothetical protein|uniref:DUF6488 family protein n=1 Tax=Spongiibacter sp. IMCC21906 TaxID=1620392 RepID=UPI00062DFA21|nr:DUF6488 family protein [Spongiibacter sp. IMCC21906]AKH68784.1 hypothetical protein IMCC21906_01105 [Spongiibacter sp. IMCC21906]
MKIVLAMVFSVFLGQQAFAHGNHQPPVSNEQAIAIAADIARGFAGVDPQLGFGALAQSWGQVEGADAAIADRGQGYLIVKVVNEAEAQALYILMSEEGEVFDANLTGKFPGIK